LSRDRFFHNNEIHHIGHNLVELGWVYFYRRQVAAGVPRKVNIFADQSPEHFQQPGNRVVQIQLHRPDCLSSRKCQQLSDNIC